MAKNLLKNIVCKRFKNQSGSRFETISDGDGLYFRADPKQNKSWIVRLFKNGKAFARGAGSYPEVTIEKARELRDEYKAQWNQGLDPKIEKKKKKFMFSQALALTFAYVEEQTFNNQIKNLSLSHQKRWAGLYKNYLKKEIGDLPLSEINDSIVLDILERIYQDKKQTANKVKNLISVCFKYAIEKKWFRGVNPARLLDGNTLIKKPKNEHMRYLEEDKVGEFIYNLRKNPKEHQIGFIYLLMVTALRVGSLRFAKWNWLNNSVLVIPKEFMKSGKSFSCPLPSQAVAVLNKIKDTYGWRNNDYIFKSPNIAKDIPISDMTIRKLFQNLTGDKYTLHGFRTLFNRVVTKSRKFDIELIESQLTHAYTKTQIRMVYLGGEDFLEERKGLVQYFADWVDEQLMSFSNNISLKDFNHAG